MGSIYKRRYKPADGTVKESPTIWIKYFRDGNPSVDRVVDYEVGMTLNLRDKNGRDEGY